MKKMLKLPKELVTVTRLSKALAMILFVALPFAGFYYGRLYQQSMDQYLDSSKIIKTSSLTDMKKTSEASSPAVIDLKNWKEFKDPTKKFSFNFPQNWLISFEQSSIYKDKSDIKLQGPEGEVDIIWADSYGGACQDPGYEKLQIKSGEETVCHAYHIQMSGHNNAEYWQLQKPFKPGKAEGIYINAFSDNKETLMLRNKNREVILKILQSLNITP